jgi:hypothetical protein
LREGEPTPSGAACRGSATLREAGSRPVFERFLCSRPEEDGLLNNGVLLQAIRDFGDLFCHGNISGYLKAASGPVDYALACYMIDSRGV